MTEEALIEILQKHDSVSSGSMLIKDILSAMREAVQRGIDEYVVTQKGHVFNIWEIEQRRKFLESVEKGSIQFARWAMGSISQMHVPSKEGFWEVIKPSSRYSEPEYKTDAQVYKEFLIDKG